MEADTVTSSSLEPSDRAVQLRAGVRVPVLMMNAVTTTSSLRGSPVPLLRLLGTPDAEKEHPLFTAGQSSFG